MQNVLLSAAVEDVEKAASGWSNIWAMIGEKAISIAGRLVVCAIILLTGHFLIKFVTKKLLNSKRMEKMDPGARGFLRTGIKIVLNAVLIISVVGVLGIPMASVVAVLGAAGAAIALALQGTLGNLASGIMILILRPFRTGDFIEVGGNLGTVLEIGMFATTIVTIDNRHVITPNSAITTSTVINYSSEENRRVDMTVSAAIGTDIEKVKAVILDYAKRDELILNDPAPFVRMTDITDSSVDFTVRMWVKNKDYWDVRFNLSENIYNEFNKNGIRIPFKQLDIHVKK